MAEDTGNDGVAPKIGSLAWMESMEQKEKEIEVRKKNRPPKIHERLNLEESDAELRKREIERDKNLGGGTFDKNTPTGTTTAAPKPIKPDNSR